jgi:transposase-like protein
MTTSNRRYSDQQRADLVVMLMSEGYPEKKGALQKVSAYAHVPSSTLHRWFREKNNPPPAKLVSEKAFDLKEALQAELQAVLSTMPDAREEATYGDLSRALGIITDKLLLLDKQPTERIAVEHSGHLSIEERRKAIHDRLANSPELRRFTGLSTPDD